MFLINLALGVLIGASGVVDFVSGELSVREVNVFLAKISSDLLHVLLGFFGESDALDWHGFLLGTHAILAQCGLEVRRGDLGAFERLVHVARVHWLALDDDAVARNWDGLLDMLLRDVLVELGLSGLSSILGNTQLLLGARHCLAACHALLLRESGAAGGVGVGGSVCGVEASVVVAVGRTGARGRVRRRGAVGCSVGGRGGGCVASSILVAVASQLVQKARHDEEKR